MYDRCTGAQTIPLVNWVLVVDDDRDVRDIVRWALQEEGYGVLEAGDGVEALACLRGSARPLVTVLDYRMPRLTGGEVLEVVAADPRLAARHAFLLATADRVSLPQSVVALARQHGIPCLPKPYDLDMLLALVAGLTARLRLRTGHMAMSGR